MDDLNGKSDSFEPSDEEAELTDDEAYEKRHKPYEQ